MIELLMRKELRSWYDTNVTKISSSTLPELVKRVASSFEDAVHVQLHNIGVSFDQSFELVKRIGNELDMEECHSVERMVELNPVATALMDQEGNDDPDSTKGSKILPLLIEDMESVRSALAGAIQYVQIVLSCDSTIHGDTFSHLSTPQSSTQERQRNWINHLSTVSSTIHTIQSRHMEHHF